MVHASHAALSLPQEWGSDSASSLVSSFRAGLLPERILPLLQTALRNEVVDDARGFIPLQEYRRLECSFCRELDVFFLNFDSLGVRMQHFGTILPILGRKAVPSCKPCNFHNICSKSKLQSFSVFSPGGHSEVATNTNSSSFTSLEFSAQNEGLGNLLEGSWNPAHFWCIFCKTWSTLSFSSLLPSSSNSNLSSAMLFSPPGMEQACPTVQSRVPASSRRGPGSKQQSCMSHPFTHMSGSIYWVKCWGRGVFQLPIASPRESALSPRNTPNGEREGNQPEGRNGL